jgi:hypothetical protein
MPGDITCRANRRKRFRAARSAQHAVRCFQEPAAIAMKREATYRWSYIVVILSVER